MTWWWWWAESGAGRSVSGGEADGEGEDGALGAGRPR